MRPNTRAAPPPSAPHPPRSHAALVAFLVMAVLLKIVALGLSLTRFGSAPGWVDLASALGGDLLLVSAGLAVARLLRLWMERMGRRAVFAIFGDHGEAFGEHLGDAFRGRYLYDTTIRVPFVVYAPEVLGDRIDVRSRFTLKDVPATLLWLVGIDSPIGVSRPAFTRADNARIYLATVYGDLKLGVIDEHHRKLVYRPERRRAYLYDLTVDPEEHTDLAPEAPQIVGPLLEDLLRWKFWHQAELRRGPPY